MKKEKKLSSSGSGGFAKGTGRLLAIAVLMLAMAVCGALFMRVSVNADTGSQTGSGTDAEEDDSGIVASGTCGDDLTWVLDEDGVLTISGSGAIEASAWADDTRIKSVVIETGVTEIGYNAFGGCTNLIDIEIPESVTEIVYSAFYGCTGLETIVIPSGVTSINMHTFAYCESLSSVTLSDNLEYIGYDAFYGCTSLTDITIPDSVETIGRYAFSNCTNLSSVMVGSGVTEVLEGAFCGQELLKIIFTGDAPAFSNWTFAESAVEVYYPAGNSTWSSDIMQDYFGTVNWIAYSYLITDTLEDAISVAAEKISAGIRTVQQIIFNVEYTGELTLTADEDAKGEAGNKVLLLQLVSRDDESDSSETDTGNSDDVTEAALSLTGMSMISESGEITFDITSSADGILVYGTNGDVSGDSVVNATDTLEILRGVSGRTALDVVEYGFADVNLDGVVNSNDLLAVVKYVSGRISSLN